MTRRPRNPVPAALIVGALGMIALTALAVWFLAVNPSDPLAASDRPAITQSPAELN